MYLIARIAGKQYRIEPNTNVKVPRLDLEEGSSFDIEEVLFATDGAKATIGVPLVQGIKAKAKVVEHGRDPKIIVFRKKRRKGFKVTRGHRQGYTLLHVEDIQGLTAKPKAKPEPKKEAKPKAAPKKKEEAKPKAAPKKKVEAKPKTAAKPKADAKPKKAPAKKKTEAKKSKGE